MSTAPTARYINDFDGSFFCNKATVNQIRLIGNTQQAGVNDQTMLITPSVTAANLYTYSPIGNSGLMTVNQLCPVVLDAGGHARVGTDLQVVGNIAATSYIGVPQYQLPANVGFNLLSANATVSNLASVGNLSANAISVSNLFANSASVGLLTVQSLQGYTPPTANITGNTLNYLAANIANLSSQTAAVQVASFGNLTGQTAAFGNVSLLNLSSQTGNIGNLIGQSAAFGNGNVSNLVVSNLSGQTASLANLTAQVLSVASGNVANLTSQVATLGNVAATNLTANTANIRLLYASNIIGLPAAANLTNLSGNALQYSAAAFGNLSSNVAQVGTLFCSNVQGINVAPYILPGNISVNSIYANNYVNLPQYQLPGNVTFNSLLSNVGQVGVLYCSNVVGLSIPSAYTLPANAAFSNLSANVLYCSNVIGINTSPYILPQSLQVSSIYANTYLNLPNVAPAAAAANLLNISGNALTYQTANLYALTANNASVTNFSCTNFGTYTGSVNINSVASGLQVYGTSAMVNLQPTNYYSAYTFNYGGRPGGPYASLGAQDDGAYSAHLYFNTAQTGNPSSQAQERMRLTSSGQLGVGTQNPQYGLDCANSARFANVTLMTGPLTANIANVASLNVQNLGGGNVGVCCTPTFNQNFDCQGNARIFSPSGFYGNVPYLRISGAGGPGSQTGVLMSPYDSPSRTGGHTTAITALDENYAAHMLFYTAPPGNYGNPTAVERMRLTSSGTVGINQTNPSAMLDVNGSTRALTTTLASGGGNIQIGSANASQITLGYYLGGYAHTIKSRHNGGSSQQNSVDIYPWQPADGVNGSPNNLMYSLTATGLGICNNPSPQYTLDNNGTFHTGNACTDGSVGQVCQVAYRVANVSYAMPTTQAVSISGSGGTTTTYTQHDWNFPGQGGAYPGGRLQVNDANYSTDFRWQTKGSGAQANPLYERFTIAGQTGYVGVNQPAPAYTLDVFGSMRLQNNTLYQQSTSPQYLFGSAMASQQCGSLLFNGTQVVTGVYGSTNQLVVDQYGHVGINNSNPGYALDVGAAARFSGPIISQWPYVWNYKQTGSTSAATGYQSINFSYYTYSTSASMNTSDNLWKQANNPAPSFSNGVSGGVLQFPYSGIYSICWTGRWANLASSGENSVWLVPYNAATYGETSNGGSGQSLARLSTGSYNFAVNYTGPWAAGETVMLMCYSSVSNYFQAGGGYYLTCTLIQRTA